MPTNFQVGPIKADKSFLFVISVGDGTGGVGVEVVSLGLQLVINKIVTLKIKNCFSFILSVCTDRRHLECLEFLLSILKNQKSTTRIKNFRSDKLILHQRKSDHYLSYLQSYPSEYSIDFFHHIADKIDR